MNNSACRREQPTSCDEAFGEANRVASLRGIVKGNNYCTRLARLIVAHVPTVTVIGGAFHRELEAADAIELGLAQPSQQYLEILLVSPGTPTISRTKDQFGQMARQCCSGQGFIFEVLAFPWLEDFRAACWKEYHRYGRSLPAAINGTAHRVWGRGKRKCETAQIPGCSGGLAEFVMRVLTGAPVPEASAVLEIDTISLVSWEIQHSFDAPDLTRRWASSSTSPTGRSDSALHSTG
ncbi:hypothetical protein FQR65_LT20993 [Abscondita terminalis]|nr:hypothetical protein FQR65_LT20993 [Abscondita terminalis]